MNTTRLDLPEIPFAGIWDLQTTIALLPVEHACSSVVIKLNSSNTTFAVL